MLRWSRYFFFSSRRRHTSWPRDWSSDVCSSDLELRAGGDTAGADRYDNLTKVALQKQISYEQEVKDAEPMLASQREVVAKLKDGLAVMKDKLGQLKVKRDQLNARAKTAQAQAQVQQAIGSMNEIGRASCRERVELAVAGGAVNEEER